MRNFLTLSLLLVALVSSASAAVYFPPSSGGSGGTPGGSSGQIQYNNGGAFGGMTAVPVANGGTGSPVGNAYGLYGVPVTSGTTYNPEGDSITANMVDTGGTAMNLKYAYLINQDLGATFTDRAVSGQLACDMSDTQTFKYENPGNSHNPVYSMMIGTNDANTKGTGAYEVNYNNCQLAALSWLTIPASFKTIANTTNCTSTGTWALDTGYAVSMAYSNTNGSKLTCPLTTYGGVLYAWYVLNDTEAGTMTVAVDGGAPVTVNTQAATAIATQNGGVKGEGVVRFTGLSAGAHTVVFTVTSATGGTNYVEPIGVGTPANLTFYQGPRVFLGGVPRQNADAKSTITAQYNSDALANYTLLAGDGLPIYFVNVRTYLNATTDMADTLHPNATGYAHLRDAFEAAMQLVGAASFSSPTFTGTVTIGGITGLTQCLHVSSSGVVSGTGSDCGSGGGSGTVTSSTAGQVAYYGATGTTVVGTSSVTISGGILTSANSDTSYGSQIMVTNNSSSSTSLAGISFTVNGVLGGAMGYQPSNYTNAAQQSVMAFNSLGANRLGFIADSNSTSVAQDIFFSTLGSNTTYAMIIKANGNVAIGTNTPQAGLDVNNGKLLVRGGTAPSISSCGTSPSISGADSSFSLTMGSGALTSCVVNFGTTWTTAPKVCDLQPTNAAAAATGTAGAYVSAISTTQLTITGLNLTSNAYGVHCF